VRRVEPGEPLNKIGAAVGIIVLACIAALMIGVTVAVLRAIL